MGNLLDSSVWVALFLDFDTQHKKAVQLMRKLKGLIYVPYCVVSEVVTVLTYKHSKAQAVAFLDYLINNRDLRFLDNTLEDEIDFFRQTTYALSFTDSSLMLLAKKLRIPLITFDGQLAKAIKGIK